MAKDIMRREDMELVIRIQQLLQGADEASMTPTAIIAELEGIEGVGELTPQRIYDVVRWDLSSHRSLYLPQILCHRLGSDNLGKIPVELDNVEPETSEDL